MSNPYMYGFDDSFNNDHSPQTKQAIQVVRLVLLLNFTINACLGPCLENQI